MKQVGFKVEGSLGGEAKIIVKWPDRWTEDEAIKFAAQLYMELGHKISEEYE